MATPPEDRNAISPLEGGELGLCIGAYLVRPSMRALERNGQQMHLSPRSMDVLCYLAERPGIVVTNEQLLAVVARDGKLSTNALHKCVTELRHAFADDLQTAAYIETVRKRGYRLVATVERQRLPPVLPRFDREAGVAARSNRALRFGRYRYAVATVIAVTCVAAALMFAFARMGWFGHVAPTKGEPASKYRSIAVLRFRSSDDDPVNDAVGEGLSDAILGGLAGIGASQVAARDLAFGHSSTREKPAAIGRALDVDYVLDGSLQKLNGVQHLAIHLYRVSDGAIAYAYERDEPMTRAETIKDKVSAEVLTALQTYLNDSELAQLVHFGTQNIDAYNVLLEGFVAQSAMDQEGLRRAAGLFRRATALDPGFVQAYGFLAQTLSFQGQLSVSKEVRSQLLAELMDINARVAELNSASPVRREIALVQSKLNDVGLPERESQVRASVRMAGIDEPCPCYVDYADLLMGARLFAEAERYLSVREKWVLNAGWFSSSESVQLMERRALLTMFKQGPYLAIPMMRQVLREFPHKIETLAWMVGQLGRIGQLDEAQAYLTHLTANDLDGFWAYFAKLQLAVERKELAKGSDELRRALDNPLATSFLRGVIEFMLGDVEAGVADWRKMDASQMTMAAFYVPIEETMFPATVTEDARYGQLLNALGLGSQWTGFMREKVKELVPITEIEPDAIPATEAVVAH